MSLSFKQERKHESRTAGWLAFHPIRGHGGTAYQAQIGQTGRMKASQIDRLLERRLSFMIANRKRARSIHEHTDRQIGQASDLLAFMPESRKARNLVRCKLRGRIKHVHRHQNACYSN